MPDPIDDGREALEGVGPSRDLWADATTRAADGGSVPLASLGKPARRGTWLAVAAAVALVAGAVGVGVGVLSMDDDASVDTTPSGEGDALTIYEGSQGECTFALRGDPVDGQIRFQPVSEVGDGITVLEAGADGLRYRIQVPVGPGPYRGAAVQLRRGTGWMVSSADFAYVSWGNEATAGTCGSFQVTVSGGTKAQQRTAAIAIADRIVLQAELPRDGTAETTFSVGDCDFAVSGDPIFAATEGDQQPRLDDQPSVRLALGSTQNALVHVPGYVVDDLLGERVEDIQLERGTAQLWFGVDFVQVRWFTGSQDQCASFTVTVAGGTEDGNRHAAVDLADRILLQDEISAALPPGGDGVLASIEGAWQLERSTVDGEPTDGAGLAFTFAGGDATWTDGCNTFAGAYESVGSTVVRLGRVTFTDVTSSAIACPRNPTAVAVQSVMGADRIEISFDGDLLLLAANNSALTLRPTDGGGPDDAGFVWPIILPNDEVYDGPFDLSSGQSTALAYATSALGWRDARIKEGEPSEDGRNGELLSVESPELEGLVSIWVATGPGPLAHVVYRVDVPGRELVAATNIHISGTTARIVPGPGPTGTVATTVKLVFDGEVIGEGAPGEAIVLTTTPAVPGAVTAYFSNATGRALSAWARPLPAGDFIGS